MINSKVMSSQTQTHFHCPSNLHKNSFIKSPSHISFNFRNTRLINPVISIRATRKSPPISAAANLLYTPLGEETLYELLGISESGTFSEIKRAYKQMALKYHPDVSPPDRAYENTMRFIKVHEAYETLSDPDARAMYDISMAKGLHLAFSGRKGSRFEARSEEKTRWKESWQVQVAELKRRSTVDTVTVDQEGRKSWASRIRKQRRGPLDNRSDRGQ
ncbi:hypothetical protein L1887_05736 [Cichorium endivia]|nr:hypothetical protein L1887_05736 [Cichorium endivia]